ncbi:MAG: PIN domain-containing protein [Patescibacteria group bacterium]
MRIFLDTNVLLAASGSETGASAYIFKIAEKEKWQLMVNVFVIFEARANIEKKLPHCQTRFSELIKSRSLLIVHDALDKMKIQAGKVIDKKDAPILAGALFSKADILCTLDKKDFFVKPVKDWSKRYGLKIMLPGDVLEMYRKGG